MPRFFKPHYVKGGLVLYLHMDDIVGGQVLDVSGQSNHGTIYGAVAAVGKRGMGLSFDGVNDYVSIPTSAVQAGNEITISCWAKKPVNNNSAFYFQDAADGRIAQAHILYGNGMTYWDCGLDEGGYDQISKTSPNIANEWHYWTFWKNASTGIMRIYIDAVLWYSGTGKTKPITTPDVGFIGKDPGGTIPYSGLIDEFSIYDRALTPAEIKYNYMGRRDIMRCS